MFSVKSLILFSLPVLLIGCTPAAYEELAEAEIKCGGKLWVVAQLGKLSDVQCHINKGTPVDKPDKYGETPLSHAAKTGQTKVAALLIKNGANVHAKDNSGRTPLHKAAKYHIGVAKVLIENGANPHVKDKRGITPLQIAQETNSKYEIELFKKYIK